MSGPRVVRSPRGTQLHCANWQIEAPYRMLQNNLDPEVAERPDDLVVYGGTGRAARSWDAFDAMMRTMQTLKPDETMLVQSGKPVGVFRTHEWAPRVLLANSNLVGDWATWDEFRRLENLGLTMYGQMTAGSWIYIGTQGILQGTYECFAEIARRKFKGTLAGTITLTAGLGGMGGAQPLAITMNDGVALCIDVDPTRVQRRVETRYLDEVADSLEDAVARCEAAKKARKKLSVGVVGNAADMFPKLLAQGFIADIVTDQTSAHDPMSYVPNDLTVEAAEKLRTTNPVHYIDRSRAAMAAHCAFTKPGITTPAMRESLALGAVSGSIAEINPLAIVMRTFVAQLSLPNQACSAKNDFIFRALAIAHRVYRQLRSPSYNQHRHGE